MRFFEREIKNVGLLRNINLMCLPLILSINIFIVIPREEDLLVTLKALGNLLTETGHATYRDKRLTSYFCLRVMLYMIFYLIDPCIG